MQQTKKSSTYHWKCLTKNNIMKIEKLYTLSQFVNFLNDEHINCGYRFRFNKTQEYNEFLKQSVFENLKSIELGPLAYLDKDFPSCICIKKGGVLLMSLSMNDLSVITKGNLNLKNVIL